MNIYSYSGELIAHYEGMIDIDDNANSNSVAFMLNDKLYIYYNVTVELIEK